MTIWAKSKNRNNSPVTLKEHTENVLCAFNQIKKKLDGNADLISAIDIAIKLHDVGKVNPYFQIRTLKNHDYIPFNINNNIYHSLNSILWIDKIKLENIFNGDKNMTKYVLSAIAYHHWKDSFDDLLRFGTEKFERYSKFLTDENLTILSKNLEEQGFTDDLISFDKLMLEGLANGVSFSEYITPPYNLYWLPKRIGISEKDKTNWILISGFLMRCDHFASFLENEDEKCPIEIEGIKNDDIKNKIVDKIKEKLTNFNSNDKRFWQKDIAQNEKGSLILVAPTGSGKTEFSFMWSNGEKFFYTLPLRSAVNQIYERAAKIFGETKTGLLHSDADVYLMNEIMKEDNENSTISHYDLSRQMSYPVMITTGDQFFPYALQPPGFEKIFATFYKSRLVIDEVQAYDPRAAAIIVKFVESVIRMEGLVLLMTATFPEDIKTEIEKRIGKIQFVNLYDNYSKKYQNLKKHKYELIPIDNKKIDEKPEFNFKNEIIIDIINKANSGKRVLVILNTVKNAQFVYNEIIKKVNNELKKKLWLFHSRFTIIDRAKKEIEICGDKKNNKDGEFQNPKPDNENIGKILVATQVVEASLDIDADILYTEIAPLDSLVQRMGRVYRRYNEQFDIRDGDINIKVIVYKNGYESGNGRVYEKDLIEKTYAILKSKCVLLDNYDETNVEKGKKTTEIINKYFEKGKFKGIEISNANSKAKSKKKTPSLENQKETVLDNKEHKNVTILSEKDKFDMVTLLYSILDVNGNYKKKFYNTLDILDAGYMSDRKTDAQKMFREIGTISVIPETLKKDFEAELRNFESESNFTYTNFKDKIISEFVVNVHPPRYNDYNVNIERVSNLAFLNEVDSNESKSKKKNKLIMWLSNIYFINYNYKEDLGLDIDDIRKEYDINFL